MDFVVPGYNLGVIAVLFIGTVVQAYAHKLLEAYSNWLKLVLNSPWAQEVTDE